MGVGEALAMAFFDVARDVCRCQGHHWANIIERGLLHGRLNVGVVDGVDTFAAVKLHCFPGRPPRRRSLPFARR